MKKKIVLRCLIGAPVGLAVSTCIAIIISLLIGDGHFYAVAPELERVCKTEINAVILQALCSLLYGAAWAGASVIWETEHWSILRQTVTHLVICSLCTFPIAYFMRWMHPSVLGIISYFGIFFAIYFVIWIIQYLEMRRRIKQINTAFKKNL